MKTIKCSEVGGDSCDFSVTTSTIQEARMKLLEHAKEAHPEMFKSATPDARTEWETKFKNVWDHAAETV